MMDKRMQPIYMQKLETLTKKYQVRLLKLEDDTDFSDLTVLPTTKSF